MVQIDITVQSQAPFRERVKKWRALERRVIRLRGDIADLEEHLRRLREDLAEGDNARAIQYDKEPVQGGRKYDATADYIADTYAEIERLEQEIAIKRKVLAKLELELRAIERAVAVLGEDYRLVLELRYREWMEIVDIESKTRMSRATIYRKIEEACATIDKMDDELWRWTSKNRETDVRQT
jgi:DNA-directed RNA polymerase specialized sigma subunit